MLINITELLSTLSKYKITINGVLHIGAHTCEELPVYDRLGIKPSGIIWIEAIQAKVTEAHRRHIPNVYCAVITDTDDETITFHVSNNVQSSSVLAFKTHSIEHPKVRFVDHIKAKTLTVDTFFLRNNIDCTQYDFWNLDIQGAELMALKGGVKSLQNVKVIYIELNEKELYKNCGLIGDVDKFLRGVGFERIMTRMTTHGWGDGIYIRTEFVKREFVKKEDDKMEDVEKKDVKPENMNRFSSITIKNGVIL